MQISRFYEYGHRCRDEELARRGALSLHTAYVEEHSLCTLHTSRSTLFPHCIRRGALSLHTAYVEEHSLSTLELSLCRLDTSRSCVFAD